MNWSPGWYILKNGSVIYVIGLSPSGDVAYQQHFGGLIHTAKPSNEFFQGTQNAPPECTGWGWKPAPPPSVQMLGSASGSDGWKGLRLWTYRTVARGDRYVFVAEDKGSNDWVELVFDGKGWQIRE